MGQNPGPTAPHVQRSLVKGPSAPSIIRSPARLVVEAGRRHSNFILFYFFKACSSSSLVSGGFPRGPNLQHWVWQRGPHKCTVPTPTLPCSSGRGEAQREPRSSGGGSLTPWAVSVGQPDGSTVGWRLGRLSGCFHHELGKYEAVPHSPSTCFMAKLSKASWAPQGSLPPCWCRKHSWTRACRGWGCPAPVRPPDFIWEPYAKLGA